MSAITLSRAFLSNSDERARLHAGLSRLWVMHFRLTRKLERALERQDGRVAGLTLRHIGRCETCLTRLELRVTMLIGSLDAGRRFRARACQ